MGTSANENIAIAIGTTADLSGTRAARADVTALGQDATNAAQQMAQAAVGATTAQNTLAGAAANAATQGNTLTVSYAEMSAALERNGGDLQKAAADLAAMGAATQQATASTAGLAVAAAEATVSTDQLLAATERQAAAEQRAGMAMARATDAAYRENAAREEALAIGDKLPANVRRGAGALSQLAFAAAGTNGSMRSVVTSAGLLSATLAQTSQNAKIAASAAGIGALAVLMVTLVDLVDKARKSMDQMLVPTGALDEQQRVHIANIKTEKQANTELALAQGQAAAAAQYYEMLSDQGAINRARTQKQLTNSLQAEANALAVVSALEIRRGEIARQTAEQAIAGKRVAASDTGDETDEEAPVKRYQRNLALIEAERKEAIRTLALTEASADEQAAQRKRDLLKSGQEYEISLAEEVSRIDGQRVLDDFALKREEEDRSFTGASLALNKQTLTQEQLNKATADLRLQHEGILAALTREQVLMMENARVTRRMQSDNVVVAVSARFEQIELERQAEIKATGDVLEATENAEQKKRQLYKDTAKAANADAATILGVLQSTNNTTLKAVGTFGENLRRIVIGAEAARALVRAAVEAGEALASAASGDFSGAALHGAAALQFGAAAAVGARESLGGGGGGGVASAGSGGGSSFPTPNQSQGSPVIVQLFTTNPNSRENIMIASYQLNRAGITKRPIYVPPTSSLQPAGA